MNINPWHCNDFWGFLPAAGLALQIRRLPLMTAVKTRILLTRRVQKRSGRVEEFSVGFDHT